MGRGMQGKYLRLLTGNKLQLEMSDYFETKNAGSYLFIPRFKEGTVHRFLQSKLFRLQRLLLLKTPIVIANGYNVQVSIFVTSQLMSLIIFCQ